MTTEHGDRAIYEANEILRTTVGSGVHGIAIPGTDDDDEMAIYIEPRANVYGLLPPADHYIFRSQDEGQRSQAGDLDLTAYSLRKYLALAIKGNPTALLPLFAPAEHVLLSSTLGDELRDMRTHFLSQEAVRRFLGYMHQQHERMLSGKKTPNRPELVAAHGFDTKYAAHALRLALQGYEIASTGHLSLPLPEEQRDLVLQVKHGMLTREQVSMLITEYEIEINDLLNYGHCLLPLQPHLPTLNAWTVQAHERFWSTRRSSR